MTGRRWELLGTATRTAAQVDGVTTDQLIGARQHAAALGEILQDYGVSTADPDDLFVVLATCELARATLHAFALRGTVSPEVATRSREVLRAIELAIAEFLPDEVRG